MPNFLYKARDPNGLLQTGRLEASDADDALAMLQHRGLIVISVLGAESEASRRESRQARQRLHGRVTTEDKLMFCQQMATLLEAGIPLLKALQVLARQVESRALLQAIQQMRQDVEAGWTFRQAMSKHPKVFSAFWLNLIETGEASGHLAESLKHLARYLESIREIQGKAVTAMIYPMVLVAGSGIAMVIFLLKIVPVFQRAFASMHGDLPALTQVMVTLSEIFRQYWLLLGVGIGALGYLVWQFVSTQRGHEFVDRLVLRLPVFSHLAVQFEMAQFARGLSTLLESGVPILTALQIMERSATNSVYSQAIGAAKEFVREGKTMAEPLENSGLFPPMMVQMVRVGEEIGELGKMLDRVARFYEDRVATFVGRLGVLFEPVAIGIMAVVVGILVLSMYLPIFKLATSVHA